jgi:hypothetical protein
MPKPMYPEEFKSVESYDLETTHAEINLANLTANGSHKESADLAKRKLPVLRAHREHLANGGEPKKKTSQRKKKTKEPETPQ